MDKYLIYGLYCPITDSLHYVGKSTVGLLRPLTHLTQSHSDKINDWVIQLKFLGYVPIIKIIEVCNETNIDEKEVYWIKESIRNGCYLLNSTFNNTDTLLFKHDYNKLTTLRIGSLIRKRRVSLNISADELSIFCNISRPTLWSVEMGSGKIKVETLIKVLNALDLGITINKYNNEITDDTQDDTRIRVARRKNKTRQVTKETEC